MAATQQSQVIFAGGLITEISNNLLKNGYLTSCSNFEVSTMGYTRCKGYERFNGRTSPASIELVDGDDAAREAQRALIAAPSGSGAILGVAVYNGSVYAFRNSVDGLSANMWKSSSSGWVEVTTGVTLAPSGSYEFTVYNFYGNAGGAKLYGVDGVNKAFEFDGTTFTQISTGMTTDTPSHLSAHQYHLFLSYAGSIMHSAPGSPLDWNVVNGAGEIGLGDTVNEIASIGSGVLAILMSNRISMLYGTSALDWKAEEVKVQSEQVGGRSCSVQTIGGKVFYLDDRGMTDLTTTDTYGNFNAATVSVNIRSRLQGILSKFIGSYRVKEKNMYCMAFTTSNNTKTEVITATVIGDGVYFGSLVFPFVATHFVSSEDSAGNELILAGSTSGQVYRLETGTSFDGGDIASFIGTSFMSQGSPTARKRYKRASVYIDSSSSIAFRVKPEFSYSSNDILSHRITDVDAEGGGGTWGFDNWGEFYWSTEVLNTGKIEINGTGNSIAFTIYSSGKYYDSYSISSCIIDYIRRRLER